MPNKEQTFDALAKGLTESSLSRRRALKLVGATLLGGLLASIPGVAYADRCPPNRQKCGGRCCPRGWCCSGSPRICRPCGQT